MKENFYKYLGVKISSTAYEQIWEKMSVNITIMKDNWD